MSSHEDVSAGPMAANASAQPPPPSQMPPMAPMAPMSSVGPTVSNAPMANPQAHTYPLPPLNLRSLSSFGTFGMGDMATSPALESISTETTTSRDFFGPGAEDAVGAVGAALQPPVINLPPHSVAAASPGSASYGPAELQRLQRSQTMPAMRSGVVGPTTGALNAKQQHIQAQFAAFQNRPAAKSECMDFSSSLYAFPFNGNGESGSSLGSIGSMSPVEPNENLDGFSGNGGVNVARSEVNSISNNNNTAPPPGPPPAMVHFPPSFASALPIYSYSPIASTCSLPSIGTRTTATTTSASSSVQSPSSEDPRRLNKRKNHNNYSVGSGDADEEQMIEIARREAHKGLAQIATVIRLSEQSIVARKHEQSFSSTSGKTRKQVKSMESQKKRQCQLFAMVVLLRSVVAKDTSVCPRNRIYNKYVMVCQQHDLSPMCNASFGKLVKLLFPNIRTRRLGIRGSSRYHYCGLKLIDDDESLDYLGNEGDGDEPRRGSVVSNSSRTPSMSPTTTAGPQLLSFDEGLFVYFNGKVPQFTPSIEKYVQVLNAQDRMDAGLQEIAQFYCSFALRVFQNLRFMKVKSLFDEFAAFSLRNSDKNTSLSPVALHTLETKPHQVCAIILQCDSDLYSSCIMLLSKIIFQNVPEAVRAQITNLDTRLLAGISQMDLPEYAKRAKMAPLKQFVGLVSQLTRVITSAATVASAMAEKPVRAGVLQDWTTLDLDRLIVGDLALPEAFKNSARGLLKNNMTELFRRLDSLENEGIDNAVIQVMSAFFLRVPTKFCRALPARDFLLCMNTLMSSIMRQLTQQGCTANFTVWWKLSCWISEFLTLLGELGGFLRRNEANPAAEGPSASTREVSSATASTATTTPSTL